LLAKYGSLKVADLKALCKEKGLPVSGIKTALISRLTEADESSPAPEKPEQQEDPKPEEDAPEPAEEPEQQEDPEPEEDAPEPAEEPEQQEASKTLKPGDRINARYHRDNKMYPGILLDVQYDGKYLISWDEPDESEPLTSCTEVEFLKKARVPLEPGEKQVYHVGDKIWARFAADNGFYEADLLELNGDKCKLKWKDPDGSPPTAQMPVHDIN